MITTVALAKDTFVTKAGMEPAEEAKTLRATKSLLEGILKKRLTLIVDPSGQISLTGNKEGIEKLVRPKKVNNKRNAGLNNAKVTIGKFYKQIMAEPPRYTIESSAIVPARLDIDLLKLLCAMGGPDAIVCSQARYSKLKQSLENEPISLPDFPSESFHKLIEDRRDKNVWHLDDLTGPQFGQLLKPVFNCAKRIYIYDYVIGQIASGDNPTDQSRFVKGINWLIKQWERSGKYFDKEELRIYTGVRKPRMETQVVDNIWKYFLKNLKGVPGIPISVHIKNVGGADRDRNLFKQHFVHERHFQACASREFSTIVWKINGFDFIKKLGERKPFNNYEVTKLSGLENMKAMDARFLGIRNLKNYCDPIVKRPR